MSIRLAAINDVESISQLVTSLSHFYLNDKKDELPEWFLSTLTETAFSERINNSEYSNFIYEEDNITIGYISMKDNSHLYHLFVSEKHQGNGIARKLWEYVANHCLAKSYTLRSSLYAVPIYIKFGFVESGIIQEKDGVRFQPMELQL